MKKHRRCFKSGCNRKGRFFFNKGWYCSICWFDINKKKKLIIKTPVKTKPKKKKLIKNPILRSPGIVKFCLICGRKIYRSSYHGGKTRRGINSVTCSKPCAKIYDRKRKYLFN